MSSSPDRRTPGTAPAGLETTVIWRRIPALLLAGTVAPLLAAWASRVSAPALPEREPTPISLVAVAPRPLMVNPGLTARTVGGLIEPVRLRPDEVNFGSAGPGAASHAGAELFQSLARTRMVRVPCNQPGVALNDLISGQISWHCTIWRSRCRM